jgi:hypothetical protein
MWRCTAFIFFDEEENSVIRYLLSKFCQYIERGKAEIDLSYERNISNLKQILKYLCNGILNLLKFSVYMSFV